jgi:carotenoid 1,2-hydratase
LSDDGEHALVVIAFVGSVFSPYYAAARCRRRTADPFEHCAFNVALYSARGRRWWTMTERGARHVERAASGMRIGPSDVQRRGTSIEWSIDEWTAPWPSRVRGRVRLDVGAWRTAPERALDSAGRHRWQLLATQAHVQVHLERPAQRWSGTAYLDTNRGSRPLEEDVTRWNWSRVDLEDGATEVIYDVQRADASRLAFGTRREADGAVNEIALPPAGRLPRTAWGLRPEAPADVGAAPRLVRGLEDGPFYARSLVASRWHGKPVLAVHESLALDRFAQRWVQALLPFRMPRRA